MLDLTTDEHGGDSLQTVGYFEAWARWWELEDIKNVELWGLRIAVWARIGKLAAFFGTFVAILDWIGPKRLRRQGRRIRERAQKSKAISRVRDGLSGFMADVSKLRGVKFRIFVWVIGIVFLAVLLSLIYLFNRWWPAAPEWLAFLLFVPLFLGAIALMFSTVLVGVLISTWLAKDGVPKLLAAPFLATAKIFERENPGVGLKILAFIIVGIGFSFDLLGS